MTTVDEHFDRGLGALAARAIDVVSANPDAFLVCGVGLVLTLIVGQYRKPFVDLTSARGVARLRLETAVVGSIATAIMLVALLGVELLPIAVLSILTGFGAPLAYDLVLWRVVDRFIRPPRRRPS